MEGSAGSRHDGETHRADQDVKPTVRIPLVATNVVPTPQISGTAVVSGNRYYLTHAATVDRQFYRMVFP